MATKEKKPAVKRSRAKKALATDLVAPADFATSRPTAGTVDVATIGTKRLKGEHFLLTNESWVVLGEDKAVPENLVGQPAAVVSSPVHCERDEEGNVLYECTPEDAIITVRERSQGALLVVPLQSCEEIVVAGGRPSRFHNSPSFG